MIASIWYQNLMMMIKWWNKKDLSGDGSCSSSLNVSSLSTHLRLIFVNNLFTGVTGRCKKGSFGGISLLHPTTKTTSLLDWNTTFQLYRYPFYFQFIDYVQISLLSNIIPRWKHSSLFQLNEYLFRFLYECFTKQIENISDKISLIHVFFFVN